MPFRAHLMLAALVLPQALPHLRAEAAAVAPPILIGLLLPPEEAEGASLRRGAQLGVDHANRSPGAKVSLLVRGRIGQWGADGEEAARMILDDGARGLIAPPGGAPSHLALQIAGRTATPVVSLCPDSSVVGAGVPWMVRIVPGTRDEARLLFAAFRTNTAGRQFHWGALLPTGRPGREAAHDLRQAADAANCALNPLVEVPPAQNDLSEIAQRVLSARPDGLLLCLEANLAARLTKALRATGFEGQLAGPSRLQSLAFTTNAGRAAEGFVLPCAVLDTASRSVADQFAAAHRQQFAEEPDRTAFLTYDATEILVELLRRAGDGPACHLFPVTTERPGASGSLKFDRKGNRLLPLELLQFQEGRFIPFAEKGTAPRSP